MASTDFWVVSDSGLSQPFLANSPPSWTPTGEGEAHRPGDRDTGLLLGLVRRRAEVRGADDLVELEQRGVR
ncbi:hypothetical protein, partial [Streptomyces sp. NTH33]|uniref:hypothetical protein n=1 Tax=Streptomyces sp. NTH33 TaxID=1735453 RepID=UPI0021ACA10A